MKILVFSQYYFPEWFLINEFTQKLVSDGNSVTVLTGLPNYPSGVIPKEYRKKEHRKENINGVNVVRCPIIGRGKNYVQLVLNYLSFMFSATRTSKKLKEEYDVVFLYQLTPICQAFPAVKYAKKHKKKLICYCLDLAPASGINIAKRSGLFLKLYTAFAKWAYRSCDKVIVSSKQFIDYLKELHDIDESILTYIPQHASDKILYEDLSKTEDDGKFHFMFAGNIGKGASLQTIVNAGEILSRKCSNFIIDFVGNGSFKEDLIRMVNDKKLNEHFLFHDAVPSEKMIEKYKIADALLVTLRKNQITVPAKLQAYMAAGKMIFGAMDGSGFDMIEESGCGKCVSAEDAQGLAKLLYDYIENPSAYSEYGKNGRRFFEQNFTLEIFNERLMKVLSER